MHINCFYRRGAENATKNLLRFVATLKSVSAFPYVLYVFAVKRSNFICLLQLSDEATWAQDVSWIEELFDLAQERQV
jgi:hypothetical protein